MKKTEKDRIFDGVKIAYDAVADKMGEDIVVLDIMGISTLSDYFIIATGNNPNQLKAMMDFVQEKLAPIGIRAKHVEGADTARWILIDFGNIIVHLFCKEDREHYRLEKLWGDANHILMEDLA